MGGQASLGNRSAKAREQNIEDQMPTDLHKLHHGDRVEEMEASKSVLPGSGIGHACDLQGRGVAGKDGVSAERENSGEAA